MMNAWQRALWLCVGWLLPLHAHAIDSYRYLHVTIDTIWNVFLLLAPLVLAPFVVLMWIYWRRAVRHGGQQGRDDEPR